MAIVHRGILERFFCGDWISFEYRLSAGKLHDKEGQVEAIQMSPSTELRQEGRVFYCGKQKFRAPTAQFS